MELRPIRTETDYREALREIELLFNAAPNTLEYDRLDMLSTLVEAYERVQFPLKYPIRLKRFNTTWKLVDGRVVI